MYVAGSSSSRPYVIVVSASSSHCPIYCILDKRSLLVSRWDVDSIDVQYLLRRLRAVSSVIPADQL